MQATAHRGARYFGAVADLRNGQVALALLESVNHGQPARQRSHEVGVAGQRLDALGGRRNDGGRHRRLKNARAIGHGWKPKNVGDWAIIDTSTGNRHHYPSDESP